MAEIRINATGGVKLYDADDSHYCQILAGTISSNVDILTLNSAGITVADGAIDFDIASHDTSNGLKLGGTLVTATAAELNIMDGVTSTAAELNIMDGVTSTAAEINLIDGGTARGTTAIADGDGVLINDNGTMRMTTVETLSTYIGGFDVSSITGATALTESLATDDEFILNDTSASGLKRVDATYMMNRPMFRARMTANQSINTGTWTKVAFDGETTYGDPDSTYDTTNYRWTPARNGWYWFFWSGYMQNFLDDGEYLEMQLYKNGAYVANSAAAGGQLSTKTYSSADDQTVVVHYSGSIYLDDDDYIEVWMAHNEGSAQEIESWAGHFGGFYLVGGRSGVS